MKSKGDVRNCPEETDGLCGLLKKRLPVFSTISTTALKERRTKLENGRTGLTARQYILHASALSFIVRAFSCFTRGFLSKGESERYHLPGSEAWNAG